MLEQHQRATAILEREDLSKHLYIPRYTTLIRQDLSLFQLTKVKHHTTSVASCKPASGRKEQVRLRIDFLCLRQYQGATTCLPWTPGSLCATGAHGRLSALQQSHCDLSACLPAASTYMCSTQPSDSHAHLGTCAACWHFTPALLCVCITAHITQLSCCIGFMSLSCIVNTIQAGLG